MKQRLAGLTIVEMLIAAAILGIVLLVLGNYLVVTNNAYDVTVDSIDELQEAQAAIKLLKYELSLAGYRGTDNSYDTNTFNNEQTLSVTRRNSGSDDIEIRYFEDRFYDGTGSAALQTVTYSIVNGNLSRQAGATNQTIIAAEKLKVTRYLKKTGLEVSALTVQSMPEDLVGFTLELTISGKTHTIAIGLNSSQDPTLVSN
jgi:Tfp pilus assembly protein PilW